MSFNLTSIWRFIKEHGMIITFRTRARGDYDVLTGTTSTVDTDYKVYTFSTKRSPYELTSDSIVISSRDIIIFAKDTSGNLIPTPQINDQIVTSVRAYDILKVNDTKSGNNVISYVCTLKD